MELKITVEDKSVVISGSESVFEMLLTLPPWKLPRTDSKVKPTILGCLMEIGEKATKDLVPLFISEYQKAKDDFQKKLDETGHVENSLTQDALTVGHFKIVRSVHIKAWKFGIEVSQAPDSGFLFTLLTAEFKPHVKGEVPAQMSKKALERDLNKNRSTAGTKKMEQLVKKMQVRL